VKAKNNEYVIRKKYEWRPYNNSIKCQINFHTIKCSKCHRKQI